MPLINKRLLQETALKHRHEIASNKKQALKELFQETLDLIKFGKFEKEESEKVAFLIKMFELLGYKHHHNLSFEKSTKYRGSIDGNLKEEDGSTTVAIEWKGIDTKDLERSGKAGETPVDQLFRYMSETKAEFGFVGNFTEFRLYSWNKRKDHYQKFELRELIQNEKSFEELVFLLKPSTILKIQNPKSELENLLAKSEVEQEQITKRFYNDYKQRRLNLFEHLVESNQDKNKHLLLEKTQKILDRLIFVMFCEDRNLLPSSIIKQTFDLGKKSRSRSETKIWEEFEYLFQDIDKGRYDINPTINAFNGGLFADDLELNNLIIKDKIWSDLVKLAEYDFESDLDVNILGHIFEQSISDIEQIKAELEGEALEKKKSKRKKDGIYYTPEYITDYIVSETVGSWLQDNPDNLNNIKILDPAGGSGAFPNQVHNYLAKEHEVKFEGVSKDKNDLFNQAQTDKSILKDNIFMVDLQPESVEIAKLSLWLKTAREDQKLNNLDGNIKCGNSLIDDPEITGDKAFDWHKEFPKVFEVGLKDPQKNIESFINTHEFNETETDTLMVFMDKIKRLIRIYYTEFLPMEEEEYNPEKHSDETYIDSTLFSGILHNLRPFILQKESLLKKVHDLVNTNNLVSENIKSINNKLYKNFIHSLELYKKKEGVNKDGKFYSIFDIFLNGEEYHIDGEKRLKPREDKIIQLNHPFNINISVKEFFNTKYISFVEEIFKKIVEYSALFEPRGFDVVVGNPPYVNIANIQNEKVRKYYQTSYQTVKNKSDLYSIFIERSVSLLKDGGYLGFIVSNSWLGTDSFSEFRKFLLENTRVVKLVKMPSDVFQDAVVTPVILILKKEKVFENHKIELVECVDQKFGKMNYTLSYDRIRRTEGLTFSFEPEITFKSETVRLGDIAKFSLGIKTSNDQRFILDEKIDNDCYPILRGRDIERYGYRKPEKWIWYKPELMMEKTGAGPRHLNYFLTEKIMFQTITGGIIKATIDTQKNLTNDKVHILYELEYRWNLKFILGIVSSNYIDKWLKSNFGNILEIKINNLQQLPIPKATTEEQTKIAELVDEIMEKKAELNSFIKNTFQLWENEFKQKIVLNNKLREFWKLETTEFINLIEKQKINLDREQKRLAIRDFESDRDNVLMRRKNIDKIDDEIEGLVRGLYGVV